MSGEFPELATVGFLDSIAGKITSNPRLPESGILLDFPEGSGAPPALLCIHEDTLPATEESEKVIIDMIDGTRPIQYKIQAVAKRMNMAMKGKLLQLNSFQVYKSRFRIVLIIYAYEALPGDYSALSDLLHGNMLSFHPGFFYDPNGTPSRPPPPKESPSPNPYNDSTVQQHSRPLQQQPQGVTNNINSTPYAVNGSTAQPYNGVTARPAAHEKYGEQMTGLSGNSTMSRQASTADTGYGPQRSHQTFSGVRATPYASVDASNRTADGNVTPIAKLGIYMPKWKIQGRVTSKSGIKTYGGPPGQQEGQVFSIEIMDKSGEIRGSFFSKAVDKFFNQLIVNRIYTFADGQIKPKRAQYNPSAHPYEIMFNENSIIQEIAEQQDVPKMTYDFVSLRDIAEKEVNSKVDVAAVIIDYKEIDQITRKDGQKTEKRDIVLSDDTGVSIVMSLWGEKVSLLPVELLSTSPIVCIRGARVSDFRGKKLDTQGVTFIDASPTEGRAIQLREWFNRTGKTVTPEPISNTAESLATCKTIEDILKETANSDPTMLAEKGVYFTCKGYVDHVNQDRFSYPACGDCRRKVVEDTTGPTRSWLCQKCGKQIAEPFHTYNLMMSIVDFTGSLKCSCWNECGEILMGGWKAGKLVQLQSSEDEENRKACTDAFLDTYFSEYIFTIRAKSETYMDETRTKYMVVRAKSAMNRLKADATELLKLIKA